jgi:NAD-dependent deacetylase sirtuin 5
MLDAFCNALKSATNVVILTGAGISAESGVPTFRGSSGLWRKYDPTELARPEAFRKNPSLVWEFYHYRRDIVSRCKPNRGHYAITCFQQIAESQGKRLSVVTQNVDRLHQAAGTQNVVELHGSIWLVKPEDEASCVERKGCVWEDRTMPLFPALAGLGAPDDDPNARRISIDDIPRDKRGKLLRPGVVWFGENLDSEVLERVELLLNECDFLIVVGTSSVVYPAAGFAMKVAQRGVPVAEFNLESTPITKGCTFSFLGAAGELLPRALDVESQVEELICRST